jgi:hypothetical protein
MLGTPTSSVEIKRSAMITKAEMHCQVTVLTRYCSTAREEHKILSAKVIV